MADDQDVQIKLGSIWGRDGKRYVVVGTDRTTKDADAANWSPAVEYQNIDASEPIRVRTRQDFLAKLKPE